MHRTITKRSVDATKATDRTRFLWDADLPGFGLRVTPNGVKSYVLQYSRHGRKRRVTVGRHGAPWTPASARDEAIRLRAEVVAGRDPASERGEARAAPTVRKFAERYMTEHATPKKKAGSAAEDRRLLDKHILPRLGPRRMADVSRSDVARLHVAMRDRPYLANRMLALLSMLFNLAERWGVRPDGTNPCRHVERFREARRERFLSAAELARLGAVLVEVERAGSEPWQAVGAIRLLLFTGRRHGEALGLAWTDVDLERGRLALRDSKTGAKSFPLPAPALDVLSHLPRIEKNAHVFPGRFGEGHFVGLTHVWQRIRKRAGLADVRIHDLRHAFASVGVQSGESLPIIGAMLGHSSPGMTARYAHLSDDPIRAAANRTARTIARAMQGKAATNRKRPSTGQVVSMRPR